MAGNTPAARRPETGEQISICKFSFCNLIDLFSVKCYLQVIFEAILLKVLMLKIGLRYSNYIH